ncbi:sulfatase [Reichenbachiella sp. MALMAid0571]|uniref:sulfatase n=1 Tax=Reichenbachiella sp. MALMAid0571 TaxID=3143939 RepID=UPI0032DE311B
MYKSDYFRTSLLLIVLLAVIQLSCTQERNVTRPNIIIILIDDMGWKDFGEAGSTYYETPNIDRMSREGIRFTKGYSSAPVCSPSRGAIYTGRYSGRTKFSTVFGHHVDSVAELRTVAKEGERNGRKKFNNRTEDALHYHTLPLTETTFADVLSQNGYKTGFLGKWHCGWDPEFWPNKRGFEYAEGFRIIPSPSSHFGKSVIGNMYGMEDLKPNDYVGDKLTDKAVNYINENANTEKPFMLVLSHFLVHGPLEGKDDYVKRFSIKPTTDQDKPVYAAMMQSVDESVGRVLQAIEKVGIDENTVVIFTSDNGGPVPTTSNYPLLGGKSFIFEAGMRIPFLVRWKGKIAPGVNQEHRIIQTDLFPTILDITGISKKPDLHKDGNSFYPLLTKDGAWNQQPIFFHFPHYTHATSPATALIDNDWKLIRFYNDVDDQYLLFNLKEDPYEQNDLSEIETGKMEKMVQLMEQYLADINAEMPVVNPDFDSSKPGELGKDYYYEFANRQRMEKKKLLENSNRTQPKQTI